MRRNVAITASMVVLAGVLSMTGCGGVGAGGSGGPRHSRRTASPQRTRSTLRILHGRLSLELMVETVECFSNMRIRAIVMS